MQRQLRGILIRTLSSLPQPPREVRNHYNLPLQSLRLKYEWSEFFFLCFDSIFLFFSLNLVQWWRWGCPFPSLLNTQLSLFFHELKHVENCSNSTKCYVRCMLGRSLLNISVCFQFILQYYIWSFRTQIQHAGIDFLRLWIKRENGTVCTEILWLGTSKFQCLSLVTYR